MKAKYLLCCICAFVVTGCSSNNGSTSNPINQENTMSSIETTIEENQLSTTHKDEPSDEKFIELYGSKFYYPGSFEENKVSGLTGMSIFSGSLNNDEIIHYFIAVDPFYENDFDEADVPDILSSMTMKFVNSKFSTYDSKFAISTDSEDSQTVLGYPFLKRTGSIHTESDKQVSDLKYCAFYGKMDFPKYDTSNIPIMWMAFTDSDSNEAMSNLETIAQNTANSLTRE